ncbi:MAG: hypothetical protein HYU99_01260 [Deltaproteobacteria bacterium]|nr:hypothetical protein [Deltaproteobacteria bacterium]
MRVQKGFKYDVLIGEEDLCDRQNEIRELLSRARQGRRTVLFAPRRYGKTSLVKNIVGKQFARLSRKHLLLGFDFMDAGGMESIIRRIQYGLSHALSRQMPVKTFFREIVSHLRGVKISVESDPVTGTPSASLSFEKADPEKNLLTLLDAVGKLAENYRLMLVLDEFQDIALVPEAEALFRAHLQELEKASVFILGSKRHLLNEMFLSANSPLYQYGDEMHLGPINPAEWLPYFRERMNVKRIDIALEEIKWLTGQLCDVPNSICELGAWIVENTPEKTKLTVSGVKEKLDQLVETKQTFPYFLQGCTENDKKALKALANEKYVLSPHADSFLKKTGLPKSTVGKIIKKLLNRGMIEEEWKKGYRISDPLLGFYLNR